MFDFALRIFLLLSPIFLIPFDGFSARYQWFQFGYFSPSVNLLQLQFFQYGTVILFMVALFNKPQRIFQDKYAGFLFLMFMLGVMWHPITIVNFYSILSGALLYYLVIVYSKDVKSILKFVIVVSFLNTIWAVLQFFDIHLIYNRTPEIIGLMTYKSHLGIYQALAVPICYALNPWLSIIPLIGLLLSKSFTAIIPMCVAMAYLLKDKIFRLRSMPFLMLIISSIVIFGGKMFYRISLRFEVWRETLWVVWQKIFYGYGVGTFNFIDSKNFKYTDPYSIYFEITYALGLFGLLALFLFIWNKFNFKTKSFMEKGLVSSCLVLVVSGLCYSFMDYPRLAGTTVVLFGLLTVIREECDGKNSVYGRA